MKSYEDFAVAIYGGVIRDATARWPLLVSHLKQDLSCLLGDVKARGLPFLTITLPAYSKVFLKALDNAYLPVNVYPQGLRLRNGRPVLFRCLLDQVFDEQGTLRIDASTDAVSFLLQLLSCCKNLKLECSAPRTKETLDEFFAIEAHLPRSHPDTWDSDIPVWKPRQGHPIWGTPGSDSSELLPLSDFRRNPDCCLPWDNLRALCSRVVHGWIGDYPLWDLDPRHGPGAVAEGRVVKQDFPNWPTKLEYTFPYDWYGSGLLAEVERPSSIEVPSRLVAVPKSQKGPRLICAEPVAHQWIQQGIWRWLEQRVEKTPLRGCIDFRNQEHSRKGALDSSRDGLLCTIDLSAASDRISTRLVEYIFQRSNLLDAFHASRTRVLSQTISGEHPRMIVLKKFSTMGSAITFPIQTLVFAILTVWALRLSEERQEDWGNLENDFRRITVFGDDIIAPTAAYPTIELVLHECGLKVNESKTFTGNHFRESCGCYAFDGVDITPAYALQPYDGSPTSLATTVETSNNFHLRGLWWTAEYVVSQLPDAELKKLLVMAPGGGSGLSLVSFCGSDFHLRKTRWDKNLHRHYVSALNLSSKVGRVQGSGEASLSQYFTEKPDPNYSWESGQASRVRLRKGLTRVYDHS